MKKFFQSIKDEDSFEKIIGGVFGVIAIVAIIVEMFLSNFTLDAIAGGTKDIASTLITVVMLIVAIKALRPNKEEPFSFEKDLKSKLNAFVSENGRMIEVKDTEEGTQKFYELYMQTDFNAYFGEKTSLRSGWFMRIPPVSEELYAKEGLRIAFHLNQGTFFGHIKPENEADAYEKIGEKIKALILRETNEKDLICQYNKSKKEIEIEFKKPLTTQDDADMFIRVIRKIYYSYLVLGEPNLDKVNSK
ncbi:MAG: hypothetical protein E7430_09335 [Ruminococcaceae bacterium]|nr:hypothetical protein [Oscillospiraceae bacterium]